MMTGKAPFGYGDTAAPPPRTAAAETKAAANATAAEDTTHLLSTRILQGAAAVDFDTPVFEDSDDACPDAASLIRRLLVASPHARLGASAAGEGAVAVMAAAFFSDVDWAAHEACGVDPPEYSRAYGEFPESTAAGEAHDPPVDQSLFAAF
jgi:hypothetical protein